MVFKEGVEIFRTGTYPNRGLDGGDLKVTGKDLDIMAAQYDDIKESDYVPVIKGHFNRYDDSAEAFGWVKKIYRKGRSLFADIDFVDEMVDLIKDGRFKNRSIGFKLPSFELDHLAMLGSVSPAVKGMKTIKFSGERDCVTSVNFDDDTETLSDKIKNGIEVFFSQYKQPLSEREIMNDKEKIAELEEQVKAFRESDKEKNSQLKELGEKVESFKAEAEDAKSKLAAFKKEIEDKAKADFDRDIEQFCEQANKDGKLAKGEIPKFKAKANAMYSKRFVEFGEGEEQKKIDLVQELKDEVTSRKPLEFGLSDLGDPAQHKKEDLLQQKITEYCEEHKCNRIEAATRVLELNPELNKR